MLHWSSVAVVDRPLALVAGVSPLTGKPLRVLPQKVIDETLAEFRKPMTYGGKKPAIWHFEALKRILDRKEPDYKT